MTLPYERKFNIGRGSDQLVNEELHKIVESVRHLLDTPTKVNPEGKLHGSLWLDLAKKELNYYDKDHKKWNNVFENKFKIVDRIMDNVMPADPVIGQLWIYNGMLMYFDGARWEPIKALVQDGSQINLAAFEDFMVLSPLAAIGNEVVDDAYQLAILGGKLDLVNHSQFIETDEKFGPNWISPVADGNFTETVIPPDVMSQYLVPNIDIDRFYIDGALANDYHEVSKICINYPKAKIYDKTPSLVHVNPGKITAINKRLVKIDKANPKILVAAYNTEFYGFHSNSKSGRLLRESETQDIGDYIIIPEGIILNYDAAQHYDYVLAITYKFSWIKSSGRLNKTSNKDYSTSYYVSKSGGPFNVFVEGYDLENKHWDYDDLSKVINLSEETKELEVSVMKSSKREYGYIREIDLQGRGVIKLLSPYIKPLILVNGEAIHPTAGDYEVVGDKIYVNGAHRNMSWCVVELEDIIAHDDMYYDAGIVTEDYFGEAIIRYDMATIPADNGMVLFIDGLLVKKEDIQRNDISGYITVPGLKIGQEYILLKDKYHNLYDSKDLVPAFSSGRADESLVFLNGELILNDVAIATFDTKEVLKLTAANGEVKLFLDSTLDRTSGEFCIFDTYTDSWLPLATLDITALKNFCYSYDNTMSAVKINIPFTDKDLFYIFAYNFANQIENPLIVRSLVANDEDTFNVSVSYIPEIGSLSVWVNGIRQYYVQEFVDGSGFKLPNKVTGKVTYIIERPEKGNAVACEMEVLGPASVIPTSLNVYKTKTSLYPGRVTVYVSGLRMPKESWTILGNNTILIKDHSTMLLGHPNNFPVNKMHNQKGEIVDVTLTTCDEILIEVRQEFQRVEETINWQEFNNWDIGIDKYDLPKEILEAQDEILIFINGVFTALRNDYGYHKDRGRGCVTILSSSVIDALCTDPFYTILETNIEKKLAYVSKYGSQYLPKIDNRITLEWR